MCICQSQPKTATTTTTRKRKMCVALFSYFPSKRRLREKYNSQQLLHFQEHFIFFLFVHVYTIHETFFFRFLFLTLLRQQKRENKKKCSITVYESGVYRLFISSKLLYTFRQVHRHWFTLVFFFVFTFNTSLFIIICTYIYFVLPWFWFLFSTWKAKKKFLSFIFDGELNVRVFIASINIWAKRYT